jgi:hypothetical protein
MSEDDWTVFRASLRAYAEQGKRMRNLYPDLMTTYRNPDTGTIVTAEELLAVAVRQCDSTGNMICQMSDAWLEAAEAITNTKRSDFHNREIVDYMIARLAKIRDLLPSE